MYVKSINHLNNAFEKISEDSFWRKKFENYYTKNFETFTQDAAAPSNKTLTTKLTADFVTELYLSSTNLSKNAHNALNSNQSTNLIEEFLYKNNIDINLNLLSWIKNFETLFSNYLTPNEYLLELEKKRILTP